MRRPARDTRKAIDAFIARKAEIDAMLARISRLSADPFGPDPAKVNWGDLGKLSAWRSTSKLMKPPVGQLAAPVSQCRWVVRQP